MDLQRDLLAEFDAALQQELEGSQRPEWKKIEFQSCQEPVESGRLASLVAFGGLLIMSVICIHASFSKEDVAGLLLGCFGTLFGGFGIFMLFPKSWSQQRPCTRCKRCMPKHVLDFMKQREGEMAALRKDLAAFKEHAGQIALVAGRSPLYAELQAQCGQKQAELIGRSEGIVGEVRDYLTRASEARRLAEERVRLRELARHIDAVVPTALGAGVTQDLASRVATLQALERVDVEAREVSLPPDPFRKEK